MQSNKYTRTLFFLSINTSNSFRQTKLTNLSEEMRTKQDDRKRSDGPSPKTPNGAGREGGEGFSRICPLSASSWVGGLLTITSLSERQAENCPQKNIPFFWNGLLTALSIRGWGSTIPKRGLQYIIPSLSRPSLDIYINIFGRVRGVVWRTSR